jgi:Ni,Fe-hydrogenase maturation factor
MHKKILIIGSNRNTPNCPGARIMQYVQQHSQVKNAFWIHSDNPEPELKQYLSGANQLIVIDIVDMKAKPCAVKVFEGIEMDAFISHGHNSRDQHCFLAELEKSLTALGTPKHRALIGIQPDTSRAEHTDQFEESTLPRICQKIFEIAENWKI